MKVLLHARIKTFFSHKYMDTADNLLIFKKKAKWIMYFLPTKLYPGNMYLNPKNVNVKVDNPR